MMESQSEIDLRYYSRWEIAAAREQVADSFAFPMAFLLGCLAHVKWDSWLLTIAMFVAGWWLVTRGKSSETERAWKAYENRPMHGYTDDD